MHGQGKDWQVELTEHERVLVTRIALDDLDKRHDADSWGPVADAMAELTQSLLARDAVPEVRRKYFSDPSFNVRGRGLSRREIFERNGASGRAIFRHPHFLKYLRYFLHGPELPRAVLDAFQQKIRDCGEPTSSDRAEIVAFARQLARSLGAKASASSEEFYKLGLECGLDVDDARSIRDGVRKLR